ncbi:hypothetical protein C9J03_20695 [Photobacterium gaetbulicola]|uniref:Uncharacterized protein n=1 Tax=Photobacterium gaetbulicola Gung47 TaxID=658445 RepID=A0A0C5W4Z0_9GAMM|nr:MULTISPECIES: hypothetical protein [Photobacterium]AJR06556.1 hypothetical protein H744_1c1534 [Photobacterium gaetbulicola Gung47]PSU03526.1 hypothetical protein C9J03_20695 [Photobacterium gaetbulicola]WEM44647.1 hypothetical protein PTW35_25645 [Photobacterium sp. DA100]
MRKLSLVACAFALLSSWPAFSSTPPMPVSFQAVPEIMVKFEEATEYRKKAVTLGRLPHKLELGKAFPTYVAVDGKPVLETENTVTQEVVIARNPSPVVGAVYNEWLVPKATWLDTYGELPLFDTFMPFKRAKSIKAIPITEEVLSLLGSLDGETAVIAVDWNDAGMKVYRDGYLTDGGYGIAPEEMQSTYEQIE